jgi:predicted subunit of tRNA(5-methylaminomethyl-2-thiouridylate) methyltransferase
MKAGVLYSGGKDSSLMAVILERMGLEVELVTANFGIYDSWKPAHESASELGFKHRVINIDKSILEDSIQYIQEDGFPNRGINHIHHEVLEIISKDYSLVADGTRRDDRVPRLQENEIRSFEDRNQVEYVNLHGFGHKTIDNLSSKIFDIKKEESNRENNSDYEVEIRCLIDQMEGKGTSNSIFPRHFQTRVVGWKNRPVKI